MSFGEGGSAIGLLCCGILAILFFIVAVLPLDIASMVIATQAKDDAYLCLIDKMGVQLNLVQFCLWYGIASIVLHVCAAIQLGFGSNCQQKEAPLCMQSWFNFQLFHCLVRGIFFCLGIAFLVLESAECLKLYSLYVVTIFIIVEQIPICAVSVAVSRALNE